MTNDYMKRVAQLQEAKGGLAECYPRLQVPLHQRTQVKDFRTRYDGLRPDETNEPDVVTIAGMLEPTNSITSER